jgi:RNA polymerase sigma-70 factor (ECF subfamily)
MTVSMATRPSMIRRAVEGDDQALQSLCKNYQTMVFRFARHMDRRADEEQVNAILLKVLELLKDPKKEFDERFGDKFTAWLYAVSENVLRKEWRHRARAGAMRSIEASKDSRSDRPLEPRSKVTSPSGAAIRREVQKLVRARLDSLPPLYRESVKLHWIEGLTSVQVAKKLKIPEATVRQRLKRAHDRLRSSLSRLRTTVVHLSRGKRGKR